MSHQPGRRGRKPASSRSTLEEAAGQLFLEQGYAATSVEDITQRAGVSRTTFFNYFDAKSDVLWAPVDDAVAAVCEELAGSFTKDRLADALINAFTTVLKDFTASRLPLGITESETMDAELELQSSGVMRFAVLAAAVHDFIERHSPRNDARVLAYAVVGAVLGASIDWAQAGISRGGLADRVTVAIRDACTGFEVSESRSVG